MQGTSKLSHSCNRGKFTARENSHHWGNKRWLSEKSQLFSGWEIQGHHTFFFQSV